MLTLLSPAKKMNMAPAQTPLDITTPQFFSDTRELAKLAQTKTPADFKALMHISDTLAELTRDRFQSFNLNGKSNDTKAAGLAFDGNVYWGLDANTLSKSELSYAQDHLRILSGLYGVLRPLDAIQPYRLEMGTKFESDRGKNLYEFWGERLTQALNQDAADHKDPTIVNLASIEYFKAAKPKNLNGPVITVKFMQDKDGKSRSVQYYTKFSRGLMARWIIQNKIETAKALKTFNLENYRLDPARSDENTLVFARPQPAKKAPAKTPSKKKITA